MAIDFGADVSTFPDLDVTGRIIDGSRVLAEAVLRRLTTPAGSLTYDADYGRDLRELLNDDMSDIELRVEEKMTAIEIEKDERILSASVTFDYDRERSALSIRVTGTVAFDREFAFVLSVDRVSAKVLQVN